jgi:nucleotide-binding universal stress UspA family protein
MFERIVAAVDGSECADRAVDLAAELAAGFGAEVIVVHLAETIAAWTVAIEAETPEEAIWLADDAVRRLKDRGVSARAEVRGAVRGAVAHGIVEVAEEEDAGLIVMGSRGLGDVAGLLLGSVAHKVLYLSNVPVLIAR